MLTDILLVIQELATQELLEVPAGALQARDTVHHVPRKVKSIQIVQDGHIEGSGRCSFLFVPADVEVAMVGAPIRQAVYQPRITVVGKDDWLVDCKDRVKLRVGQPVWMFGRGLNRHQVNHIDDADFDIGEMLAQ